MRYAKKLTVVAVSVFALLPLSMQSRDAQAQTACCRIQSNGVPIGAESFRCNLNAGETRRLAAGQYEVDFTPVGADVTRFTRLATLDTQVGGSFTGTIGVSDRAGDPSSVFVLIQNNAGAGTDAGFNLCLF